MHGEELVVGIRVQHFGVGLRELHAHDEREQPRDEEEDERGVDVPEADALVVDAVEEPGQSGRVLPLLLEFFVELGLRLLDQGHDYGSLRSGPIGLRREGLRCVRTM